MAAITWLHLSDLHFRAGEQHTWDQNIVLRKLLDDVRELIEPEGLRPSLIVVTGDIAFCSAPQEYVLAAAFFDELLRVTGLPKARLFVAPGNHDVDRGAITRGARALAATLKTAEAISDVLTTATDRRLIFARFDRYAQFVKDYYAGAQLFDDEHYYAVQQLRLAGLQVAVLGLNSAWLARGGNRDRGCLALGERQVRQALDASRDADLRIALLHHPFDWLYEADRRECEPLLTDGCGFILHGHLHHAGLLSVGTPDTQASVFAAGACYETRDYRNSYNLVRLDPDAQQGTVYLRRYSDEQGGFWAPDVQTYKRVRDGVFRFAWSPAIGGSAWGPYQILEKHLRYQYHGDRRATQVKRFRIEALRDNVTSFRDRYKWSGAGKCDLSLVTPGARLSGPYKTREPEGAPWDVYEVQFDPPLARGEVRDIEIRWDLYDEAGQARTFYATTISVPTKYLRIEIPLHRPPLGVKGVVLPSDPDADPIEVSDLRADTGTNTISWEVKQPRLRYRYLITWQWQ